MIRLPFLDDGQDGCRSRPGREPLSRAKVSELSGRRIAIVRRNADIRGAKTRLAQRGR